MKKSGWLFCALGVLILAMSCFAAPVPDTGQTKCYDTSGNVINCPLWSEEPYYGQDASYTINPPSYTKLDDNGNALPDSATSWAMVQDNVTGLIWEVKQNKDEVSDYSNPHDADNIYTWYDPTDPEPGTPGDGTDTQDFIDALNAENFGGHSDWRIPTVQELAYIANYGVTYYPALTIDTRYFPNTVLNEYWSSTSYAAGTYAWYVSFYSGVCMYYYKSGSFPVRAVRGGPRILSNNLAAGVLNRMSGQQTRPILTAAATYTDNGDGTVTDISNGLMWQQDTPDSSMTWQGALAYCEGLTLAGYTDWRLPTNKELLSLVDYSQSVPAINAAYFPDTQHSYYYSSTTWGGLPRYAWWVDFFDGTHGVGHSKESRFFVRSVRDGQSVFPEAIFSATPTGGPAPLTVQFADQSTGTIISWAWNFGDGNTSSEQNPSHIYTVDGIYNVTLIVTGPSGSDTETKTAYITVSSSSCAAEKVVNDTAMSNGEWVLYSLRAFRDGFLSKSEFGKSVSHLYYQHSAEGIRLLMEHPEWVVRSAALLEKILPDLLHAGDSGVLRLDASVQREMVSLLDDVKPHASPELGMLIDMVRTRLR